LLSCLDILLFCCFTALLLCCFAALLFCCDQKQFSGSNKNDTLTNNSALKRAAFLPIPKESDTPPEAAFGWSAFA
jgi:hypothetical protein